jgi:hypothetical protein
MVATTSPRDISTTMATGRLPSCHLLVLLVLFLARVQKDVVQAQAIAGYLPDYRSYINVNATVPFLTDIILFSIVPHSRGILGGCCLDDHHFQQAREARNFSKQLRIEREQHSGVSPVGLNGASDLKIWVTLGGGGERSHSFMTIAKDPEKRRRLIDRLKSLWYVCLYLCVCEYYSAFDFMFLRCTTAYRRIGVVLTIV